MPQIESRIISNPICEAKIQTAQKALPVILQAIAEKEKLAQIILFGSVAKNQAKAGSDTDLLLLFNRKHEFSEYEKIIAGINLALKSADIDPKQFEITASNLYFFENPLPNQSVFIDIKNNPYLALYRSP